MVCLNYYTISLLSRCVTVMVMRPRFRPNKVSAHKLAIGFDPACEY